MTRADGSGGERLAGPAGMSPREVDATVSTRLVEHRDCRLAYEVCGDGPPVVLIHGVGVHGGGWRPQVDGLRESFRCLTLDNRGMGRSQPLGARLTVEQMAEDVRVLMDAEGWQSAHLVGHSLGGLIAMQVAIRCPERVRSLALLCTAARGRDLVRMSWWTFRIGLRTKLGTRRLRRRAFLQLAMPPAVLSGADRDAMAEELAPLYGYDLSRQPPVALRQAAATRRFDATPHLEALAALPTLVVSASEDRLAPPELGRALAAALPGSRYAEVPGAAHGVTLQCPEKINALLLEHLAGAGPHRSPAEPGRGRHDHKN